MDAVPQTSNVYRDMHTPIEATICSVRVPTDPPEATLSCDSMDKPTGATVGCGRMDKPAEATVDCDSMDKTTKATVGCDSMDKPIEATVGCDSRDKPTEATVGFDSMDKPRETTVDCGSMDKPKGGTLDCGIIDKPKGATVDCCSIDKPTDATVDCYSMDKPTEATVGCDSMDKHMGVIVGFYSMDLPTRATVGCCSIDKPTETTVECDLRDQLKVRFDDVYAPEEATGGCNNIDTAVEASNGNEYVAKFSKNANEPLESAKSKKRFYRSLSESMMKCLTSQLNHKETINIKHKDFSNLFEELNMLDEKAQENIICYLKMGSICENLMLNHEDIYLQIATHLKDNKLLKMAERLLIQRTACDNCLDMFQIATTYELLELKNVAMEHIVVNFPNLCESSEIVWLGQKVIQELIQSPLLRDRKSAMKAVDHWYNYEKEPRKEYYETMVKFLQHIEPFRPPKPLHETFHTYNVYFRFDESKKSMGVSVYNINTSILKNSQLNDVCSGEGFAVCCCQRTSEDPPYVLISGGTKTPSVVQCFDVVEGTSKKLAKKLNKGRTFHNMEYVNRNVYVLGGIYEGECVKNIDKITNTNSNWGSWTKCAELLFPVYKSGSCVYNNSIYLFGGLDKHNISQKCVQKFDSSLGEVTIDGELPFAVFKCKALVAMDEIIIVSKGQKTIGYNPNTRQCRLLDAPPIAKGKPCFFSDGKEYYFTSFSKKSLAQNDIQQVFRLDLVRRCWQATTVELKNKMKGDVSCRIDIPAKYQCMVPFC